MTDKRLSTAKIQYESYQDFIGGSSDYVMATIFLKFPVPLNYELWRNLHLMKGDWIE